MSIDTVEFSYHPDWMTDDNKECHQLLADLFGGFNHLTGKVTRFGHGIQYNTHRDLGTYDFNELTRLVVMAHDRCIRASICGSGPGLVKIVLNKRTHAENDGSLSMWEWHPKLEHHIAAIRKGERA